MTGRDIFELVRVILVIALVVAAAALATPVGRLPLALRGVMRIMRRDGQVTPSVREVHPVSAAKRLAAFALVVLAVVFCMI